LQSPFCNQGAIPQCNVLFPSSFSASDCRQATRNPLRLILAPALLPPMTLKAMCWSSLPILTTMCSSAVNLCRIALDEQKRVAFIICTSGDGGGNDVGTRPAGARPTAHSRSCRALASLGIENLWFFRPRYRDRMFSSLDHGTRSGLDEIVRWWHHAARSHPHLAARSVAGENHEDHQASSVLATEAFDLAATPPGFPSRFLLPRPHRHEQPDRSYCPGNPKSSISSPTPLRISPHTGTIPPSCQLPQEHPRRNRTHYETTTVSPSHHVSYAQSKPCSRPFIAPRRARSANRRSPATTSKTLRTPSASSSANPS